MSVQDDIFDIEDVLKGKREYKQFQDIISYIAKIENDLDAYKAFYKSAVDLKFAIDKIEKKGKR